MIKLTQFVSFWLMVTQVLFRCRRYRWELWCTLQQLPWRRSLGCLCGSQSLQPLQSPSFTRLWYTCTVMHTMSRRANIV